jgi:hypothetical protein
MRILAILIIGMFLTSCGTFKKWSHRNEVNNELQVNTASKSDTSVKSESKTDRDISTKIIEKIDTQISIPTQTASVARPLTELIENGIIKAQDGNTTVEVRYDPTTGTVKATGTTVAHTIPVQATKITDVQEDYKSSETVKAEGSSSEDVAIKKDEETTVTDVTTEKKTGGVWTGVLLGIILMLLIILGVAYIKRRFL